uniref:Mitochondrial processing peptidase beta subunit n=1 Tax=Meloidogyne incognita TaxID=6306 RepID=A0A914MHB6_MELIC
MLLNKISLFSNSRLNVKNIFAFKNLSSNVISSKAHFSHQPNVKSNIIDSGYKLTTLPSGFRVASETLKMSTATVGVWIDAGSRYEDENNSGVAHFFEHMAFKGTKKRTQHQLELEVEDMGAHLNAYTSREHTVYYAKCLSSDLEKSVEILSDILLRSVYDEGAIYREQQVILREAESIEQNVQEVVFDHLHAIAFAESPLERTILGSCQNIKNMTRDHLIGYVKKYYKGPRMVLTAAGGVDHDYLVELGKKYFGNIERGDEHVLDYERGTFKQSTKTIENPEMKMTYGTLAVEGTSWTNPDNVAIQVANTMIGQYDRTQSVGILGRSTLANSLGHDSGVESFMAYTTSYKDVGLTGIYFCAEPRALENLVRCICDEWRSLSGDINVDSLERAKSSLLTNCALILDGSTAVCEDIGRQILIYGKRLNVEELAEEINAVTPDTIRSIGERYYLNKPFSYVVVGNTSNWPGGLKIKKMLSKP